MHKQVHAIFSWLYVQQCSIGSLMGTKLFVCALFEFVVDFSFSRPLIFENPLTITE